MLYIPTLKMSNFSRMKFVKLLTWDEIMQREYQANFKDFFPNADL